MQQTIEEWEKTARVSLRRIKEALAYHKQISNYPILSVSVHPDSLSHLIESMGEDPAKIDRKTITAFSLPVTEDTRCHEYEIRLNGYLNNKPHSVREIMVRPENGQ